MEASAHIVVGSGLARSGLEVARSSPPFSIRRCGARVLVAASAAGPVGGDHVRLDVCVRPGACADIGSVGAMSIHPGPTGAPSRLDTSLTIGAGAHLDWWPEPTVSIVGSDHSTHTVVDLADDATCRIVEEVSLGRSGEAPGRLRLTLDVTRAGRPLVRHTEALGPIVGHTETFGPIVGGPIVACGDQPSPANDLVPGAGSLVSVGRARHVLSAVLVGIDAGGSRTIVTDACRAAWLPQARDVTVVLAVGVDRPAVRRALDELAPELTSVTPGARHQR